MSDKKEFPIIRWAKRIAGDKWRHSERWELLLVGGSSFVVGAGGIDAYFGFGLRSIIAAVVDLVMPLLFLLFIVSLTVMGVVLISIAVLATYYIHAKKKEVPPQ